MNTCQKESVPQTDSAYFCLLHHLRRSLDECEAPKETAVLFNGVLPQGETLCADAQVSLRFMLSESPEGYVYRAWVQRMGTTESALPMEFTLKKEVLYTYREPLDGEEESWQFLVSESVIRESNVF